MQGFFSEVLFILTKYKQTSQQKMVRSKMALTKKSNHAGVDFKKIKHKVGRRLPPPKNATNVEVKSRAIILPEQSLTLEKGGLAVNRKQQTLKELLMQTTHHNGNVRRDALIGIKDLIIRYPKEIKLHKLAIIEKLSARISDVDRGVRDALFLVLKSSIFPGLPETTMGPLISIMMAHIFNAMTQLAMDIRLMAFKFLDLVVQHYQSTVISNYVIKVLQNYVDLLGKSGNVAQDKAKLRDVLNSLVRFLSSLQSNTQPTNLSSDQEKAGMGILHGYRSSVPKKTQAVGIISIAEDGISGFIGSLQMVVPALLECWAECAPSVCSVPAPDGSSLDCMVAILQGLSLVFRCLRRKEPSDSRDISPEITSSVTLQEMEMQKWVKDILPLLSHRLHALFPFSPSLQCSHKMQEQFVALNVSISEITLEIAQWIGIYCLPAEIILQYIENSLQGQMLPTQTSSLSISFKKFSEKHVLSLIPFIPKLTLNVTAEWKERLLKAFTLAFTGCKTNSTMKLTCLTSVEDMLLHKRHDCLSIGNTNDKVLERFQRQWIHLLPKLLWELGYNHPSASKAVLQVLLHLGRVSPGSSELATEYTELQPTIIPFFSVHMPTHQNKVKVLYGPFVKLPKDCQALAVDSLYYHSNLSSPFLESLARCCVYRQLDVSIMVRIVQVLHAAFKKGHSKIADQLSFLLTLIVHCKVIPDKLEIYSRSNESEQDLSLGFGRYKAVTRAVCTCLSEMGDENLVLQILHVTICQELARKRSLDITCSLLRVVVVLSSKSMQLSEKMFAMLPKYIADYLVDIAHDHMIDKEIQKWNVSYKYYIQPCIFLFSRSEKLTSLVFNILNSFSLEGSSSESEHLRHLSIVSWVVIQVYKNVKIHKRLASCEASSKAILLSINAFQDSHGMNICNEEKQNLMSLYIQLKVTLGAVHNWKVEPIGKDE